MKSLNLFFNLRKHSFASMKILFVIFSSFFISSAYAASTTCPGTNHNVTIGPSSITEDRASSSGNYHQLTVSSAGSMTIVFTNRSNKTTTFYVGNACNNINSIYNGNTAAVTHSVPSFSVVAGQIIQVFIDDIGNNEDYTIAMNLVESNTPPVADAGEDQTVPRNSVVTLDGTGSSDANGNALTYSWSFISQPSGSTATLSNATASQPTFTANVDGVYVLQLIVNDGTVNSDPDTVTITAENTKPVANAGSAQNVLTNTLVTLDGTRSSDANGDTLTYSWTFSSQPAGSTATLSNTAASQPTFTADINGTYILQLIVNDGTVDSDADTVTITASEAPVIEADLNITKTALDTNGNVVTSLPLGADFQYIIDVGNLGPSDAENIVVTDVLPAGITNISLTNTDSNTWTCNENSGTVTCSHDGNLTAGSTDTITIDVTAPSTEVTLTNEASVTSDNDPNNSNNTTSVDTDILNTDIEHADHLCYISGALDSADCEKRGNFYYGNGCTATIMIVNRNTTSALSNVVVTKMYAPDLQSGTFSTTKGTAVNGGQPSSLTIPNHATYTEGYIVNAGTFGTSSVDMNFTITDEDSDSGNGANALTGIGIYGTYSNSGFNYSGRVYACDGSSDSGIQITSSADIIDTPITDATTAGYYNNSADTSNTGNNIKYIQTMVASAPSRSITGVHLDLNGAATQYTPSDPTFDLVLVPYLIDYVNGSCSGNIEPVVASGTTDTPLLLTISNNAYSATGNIVVSPNVRKSAKFQTIIIDPDTLSVEGQQCIMNSSTTGNFAGVAQCANSEHQYTTAFGQDAWDRCGTDSGKPCISQNHGVANINDPSFDPNTDTIYVNDFGCYLCTFNIQPVCSTDEFAIRPEKFDMGMSHTDAPNLLRAGEGYSISLTARDAVNTVPVSYTVTDHNFNNDLNTSVVRYFKDNTVDTSNILHGESELSTSSTSYMVSGLSSLNIGGPTSNGTADEIIDVTYNDVGKIDLFVFDSIWAAVDNDDTPMDCNSTEHTYICGDRNVTFIPHHFSFSELNITNHAGPDGNFTYIADDRGMPVNITAPTRSPMAARVHTQIKAMSKDNNITQNFRQDHNGNAYYENNISVTLNVSLPSSGVNSYLYPDANASNISNTLIGFGRVGLDSNGSGTRDILWNESTYPLEFNFDRNMNEPGNPFDVNGSYLSISMLSHYIDPDDGNTADITGSRIGDSNTSTCIAPPAGSCVQQNAENNATFYFGRAVPLQPIYDDVTTSSENTPVYVYIYCDPTTAQCTDYNIPISTHTNEFDWWFSVQHDMSQDYGDIELETGDVIPSGTATVTTAPSVTIDAGADGKDENVVVTATSSTPRPMTVEIDLVTDDSATDYTHPWLIYNPDFNAVPSPFYRVIFTGGVSGWMGKGQTGHVIGDDINTKDTNRVEW